VLSLFSTYLQNRCRSPNLTQKCSTMSAGNPFILGSKGRRSRSQGTKACVGLQTEQNIASGCVYKQCWVFPAARPRHTSHASNTRFPSIVHDRYKTERYEEAKTKHKEQVRPALYFLRRRTLAFGNSRNRSDRTERTDAFQAKL